MTSKERVLAAIRCEESDRVPWVPFVGCHAGSLVGLGAEEYLQSSDHIIKGVQKAIDMYRPDGIPVAFDLQIEAEIFGCELKWSKSNPPAVCGHPLCNGTELEDLKIPSADEGRIKTVVDAAKALRAANPDIALYATVTGPFTLALHLLGTDIFMKMFDDAEYVNRLMDFCKRVCMAVGDYYIDAGCDVVAVVDPMTSQIGPDQLGEFVGQHVTEIFDHIRSRGCLGSFFVRGQAQQNIAAMCNCRPDNISIDENIPLEYVRDICLEKGISFGGNMQLTTVLLLGSAVDAKKNAIACMEIGGKKGYILAPGCDLPYDTPSENLKSIIEIVEDEYQRGVVKAMVTDHDLADKLNLSEYGNADKVIVDIVTLDSEACAPCQYMVDAVRKVAPEFEDIVEWREHKIKYRESLVFMTSLMVRNVPTICIDGEITFVSRIPPKDELIAAIQKRINEKFRLHVKQHKASLYILGTGCELCCQTRDNIERAIKELGAWVSVKMITDETVIRSYGIEMHQTPAVVMARYTVKSAKVVPELLVIKEWIKDLK